MKVKTPKIMTFTAVTINTMTHLHETIYCLKGSDEILMLWMNRTLSSSLLDFICNMYCPQGFYISFNISFACSY